MKQEERKEVLDTLDKLYTLWEDRFDCILQQMEQEQVDNDFFEDLYEILYEFHYNDSKLLARVWKLMDQKTAQIGAKNEQNRYN